MGLASWRPLRGRGELASSRRHGRGLRLADEFGAFFVQKGPFSQERGLKIGFLERNLVDKAI
jgi:hypothetical protein